MKKEKQFLTIDTKDKSVLDDSGYGFSIDSMSNGSIKFKINPDSEIENLSLGNIYDENMNYLGRYNGSSGISFTGGYLENYEIYRIDNDIMNHEIIKIEITSVDNNKTKPFVLKLK